MTPVTLSRRPERSEGAAKGWVCAATVLGLLASGCTGPEDIVCTENLAYGLSVQVRDSISGIPAGRQATVAAQ